MRTIQGEDLQQHEREMNMAEQPIPVRPDEIDPASLHAKYLQERDRRLRKDGWAQYVDINAQPEYLDDPYVEPGFTRAPIDEEIEVAIIGGGFSALMTASRLKKDGIDDIRIIERAADFGGTWYWNRYPGAACDVESYIYMPLLEEVGTVPSQKYAGAAEIWEHTKAIGRHFGLYENALFQTEVRSLDWDEASGRWLIRTSRGDLIRARFVCLGVGQVTRPKLPGIPGIESFRGESFHTSRWDYGYTGGGPNSVMEKLKDKRVAIIGTGATAVQAIPPLGESAGHLFVFQRTPSAVDIRANRPTDYSWAKALQPGWQRRRMENFDSIIANIPQDEDLVGDSWTDVWRNLLVLSEGDGENGVMERSPEETRQLADYTKMEQIRRRVDMVVKDKATAEALKPWYNLFCKRPCFHDGYLQTYNRPNVTLVDTKGRGVERITEKGLVFEGVEYEVDLIVYATGFEQNAPVYRAGGFDVNGVGGASLEAKFEDGVQSLHGITSKGFPNLFMLGTLAQAGGTVNFPLGASHQCEHVSYILKRCADDNVVRVETTAEAETAWAAQMEAKHIDRDQFLADCTPGYYNWEGDTKKSFLNHLYGGGAFEYFRILQQWRNGRFEKDFHLEHAPARVAAE